MSEPIRLKIISDGTLEGSRVTDQDGRVLHNVVAIDWTIGQRLTDMGQHAVAVITIVGPQIEVETPGTVVVAFPEVGCDEGGCPLAD